MQDTYGGQVIGRALHSGGVKHVFGVHGSINLAIEEANRLGIPMVHFRHEQSAGFAADAYARCLRQPGVCFASSAPGWTNIVSPIAQAKSALSPVVLLVGQHGTPGDGLHTVQEGYAAEVLRPMSKWTQRCLDWNLHSYWVEKALRDSQHYAPGPVVLEFPRNTLNAKGADRQGKTIAPEQRPRPVQSQGDPVEVERLTRLLLNAERPLLIAGDGVYWSRGEAALQALAEALNIPVHSRRTARGAVREDHRLAVTGGYRSRLLKEADVICIVGLRATWLDEWFEPPEWRRDVTYLQIQETPDEVWPAIPTEGAVIGACGSVLKQMTELATAMSPTPPARDAWLTELGTARQRFKERQRDQVSNAVQAFDQAEGPGLMHPHILGARIAEFLDEDATIIFDSFTGTSFLTDKLESKFAGQILDAGLHQPVGHGIGMAVGAQVARPGRQVLTLVGDGGFGIGGMDMDTLVRYNLPAVVVLLNNNSWSGVAAGHDQFYPGMDSWDNLPGIRYDRMFAEMGVHGEHVERPEDLLPALDKAFSSGKPAIINVVGDTTEVHPLRTRVCAGDTWARGNVRDLPESGRAEIRRWAATNQLGRIQKYWSDQGVDIPMTDLTDMVAAAEAPQETAPNRQ